MADDCKSRKNHVTPPAPAARWVRSGEGMVYCRHYKMSSMIDQDEKLEYCWVEKITIEEGDEKGGYLWRLN
jgi:hypothetical protein